MIKFIATLLAAGFLATAGAVAYSKADECPQGTEQEILNKLSTLPGIHIKELEQTEVTSVLNKKGPPPGSTEPYTGFTFYLANLEDKFALFIIQNGCFIFRAGPVDAVTMGRFLGRIEANN